MKPIERLHAAVNFEEYDRPPFTDTEWPDVDIIPHFSGCVPRKDRKYAERDRVRAMRASLDTIPYCFLYRARYPVFGETPEIKEGDRHTWEGFHYVLKGPINPVNWVVSRPFLDANGFVKYLDDKINRVRNTSPQLPSDFKEKLKHGKKRLGDTVIGHSWVSLCLEDLYPRVGWDILGPVIIEKPELIAEYLLAEADLSVKKIHIDAEYFKECPFAMVHSDIAYNGGLLLSPSFLRMALKPALKKVVVAFHEHGIKVIYHSEGDLRKFIDDLIEVGCDGINPLAPSENMDAVKIRQKYPNLILWGGIDNKIVLPSGTPDEVEREVRRVVNGVGRGLILGSSGGVDLGCKLDNCIAMVESLQKMGREGM